MKKSLVLSCLLGLAVATTASAQVNDDLRGLDGMRCQTILSQDHYFLPFMALAHGYVSAQSNTEALGGEVYKDMVTKVIEYCAKNPLGSPWDVIEHYQLADKS